MPDSERPYWIAPDEFESVLELIRSRSDVCLTFDDGNSSDVDVALPRLLERGVAATFFVPAGHVGCPGYVDAAGVESLLAAGMRIGSHGLSHVDWRTLDEAALTRELVDARRELEAIVASVVDEASCPFGSYDRRVLARLRAAGYRHVFTSDNGWSRDGAWLQTRNTLRAGSAVATTAALLDIPAIRRWFVPGIRQTVKRWR